MHVDHLTQFETNCPYCAERIALNQHGLDSQLQNTPCCKGVVDVRTFVDLSHRASPPNRETLANYPDLHVPHIQKCDNSRPISKWTHVATDGRVFFVRISPKNIDCSALGFPWGMMVGTPCATEVEAHLFADRIDAFLDAAFVAIGDQ